MVNSIIASLIIALITGITFLAYKHPKAYSRLFLGILAVMVIIESAAIAWNAGISIISTKLLGLIPEPQRAAAKVITENLSLSNAAVSLIFLGAMAFILFLLFMPDLLSDDKKKEKPEEK